MAWHQTPFSQFLYILYIYIYRKRHRDTERQRGGEREKDRETETERKRENYVLKQILLHGRYEDGESTESTTFASTCLTSQHIQKYSERNLRIMIINTK